MLRDPDSAAWLVVTDVVEKTFAFDLAEIGIASDDSAPRGAGAVDSRPRCSVPAGRPRRCHRLEPASDPIAIRARNRWAADLDGCCRLGWVAVARDDGVFSARLARNR